MMNDIEMPLIESRCNNSDTETIKYLQKICLYLLLICMGMILIMLFSEYFFGRGEIFDNIARIVIGMSLVVSSVMVTIILYNINL